MWSGSSRFQSGEGPSRGLLGDYEPSDGTFWSTTPHPSQPASRHNNTNNITGQHTSPVINCLLFYATVSNYLPTIYCTRVRDIWPLWGWVNYLSQTIYSREFVFNWFFTSFCSLVSYILLHVSTCYIYITYTQWAARVPRRGLIDSFYVR